MKINTALALSSCLLLLGCTGVEGGDFGDESIQESIGAAEQGLCSSHCQCAPGYQCSSGSCVVGPIAGPIGVPDPCYADCQCSAGKYCRIFGSGPGSCTKPEIRYSSGSGAACGGDAGVSHPSPDALLRVTIYGKPGAGVAKYNRHYSCGAAAQWWRDTDMDGYVIPSNGVLSISYPTSAPFACNFPILGGWESYVIVGGLVSDVTRFTYYNSPCGGSLSTCTSASGYCPQSGPCNGLGCP